jgi:hypothetical protein
LKVKYTYLLLIIFSTTITIQTDWVQVNNGLTQLNVNALTSYTSNGVNYIFAGTLRSSQSGIYMTTNNGNNWALVLQIPNAVWALASTSSGGTNYVFAGTQNGLGYTTNNGLNWLDAGLPHEIYSISANGSYVFAGCKWWSWDSGGVYKSTNFGTNWTRTSLPINYAYLDYYGIIMNGNYVFAGAGSSPYGGNGLYRSTDYGTNWTIVTTGVAPRAFVFNGNNIFAGGGTGVWVSTDNGTNWTQTSLNNGTIHALSIYGNTIFAGGYVNGGGFLTTTNNGATWQNRSEGGANGIRAICIINGYIFAGTDGGGVIRRPLSELVGIEPISGEIPSGYKLEQNYPNPFNSTTKIGVQISKKANVIIKIFDVMGRETEELLNEILREGIYEFNYNINNKASGVYFYKLFINGLAIDTKKLILIK